MKFLVIALALTCSSLAHASLSDCQNLHIGRIWIEKDKGLRAVVYLNARGNTSGSYWSYFTSWPAEDKKDALSLLLAAKMANHRVNIKTDGSNNCGIEEAQTNTTVLYLTTNP